MGQKINPIIFQLTQSHSWKSKYFEKKTIEHKLYSKNDFEIRNFICKFFKNLHIEIHNLKIQYSSNSLNFFISYFQNSNSFSKTSLLFEKLFIVLHKFTKNKNIFLFLKKLNENLNKKISTTNQKNLKKKFVALRKYRQNTFFKNGVNLLFFIILNKKSSDLLAKFIAFHLANIVKKHNFFLKFIKNTLISFFNINGAKFKGIKISIKGRLNGNARAKTLNIQIFRVSLGSIKNNIDYSEMTSFTFNGTLSVKIWAFEKNE